MARYQIETAHGILDVDHEGDITSLAPAVKKWVAAQASASSVAAPESSSATEAPQAVPVEPVPSSQLEVPPDFSEQMKEEGEPSNRLANLGREFLGGAAGGVADIVGGVAGFMAAPGRQTQSEIAKQEARIAELSAIPSVFDKFSESEIAAMPSVPTGYRTPQQEAELASKRQIVENLKGVQAKDQSLQTQAEDFQKLAQEASKESQTFFGQDSARQDQFLSKLAKGAGSLPPYIASAMAGGPVLSMITGALQTGQNEYNAAIEAGHPELADEAMAKGMTIGLTEGVGVGGGLSKAAKGFASKALSTLLSAFKEGGQEWVQQTLQNLNASKATGYDPKRPATQGSGEAFAIGALLGGGLDAATQTLSRDKTTTETPSPAPAPAPTPNQTTAAAIEAVASNPDLVNLAPATAAALQQTARIIAATPEKLAAAPVETPSPEPVKAAPKPAEPAPPKDEAPDQVLESLLADEPLSHAETKPATPEAPITTEASRTPARELTSSESASNRLGTESKPISDFLKQEPLPPEVSGQLDVEAPTGGKGASSALENRVNGEVRSAEILGDLTGSETFRKHGFGGLDIPTQRMVVASVLRVAHNPQILKSIVASIPIDVVNVLRSRKLTPEMALHNEAMLSELLSGNLTNEVAGAVNATGSMVIKAASDAAKMILPGPRRGNTSPETGATIGANEIHGGHAQPSTETTPPSIVKTREGVAPKHETPSANEVPTSPERVQKTAEVEQVAKQSSAEKGTAPASESTAEPPKAGAEGAVQVEVPGGVPPPTSFFKTEIENITRWKKVGDAAWKEAARLQKEAFEDLNRWWDAHRNLPSETEDLVKMAVADAKKNGVTPEFRSFFGGIKPELAGTTPEKVRTFAKSLGMEWRSEPSAPTQPATASTATARPAAGLEMPAQTRIERGALREDVPEAAKEPAKPAGYVEAEQFPLIPDAAEQIEAITAGVKERKAAERLESAPDTAPAKMKVQKAYLLDALDKAISEATVETTPQFATEVGAADAKRLADFHSYDNPIQREMPRSEYGMSAEEKAAVPERLKAWEVKATEQLQDLFDQYAIPTEAEPFLGYLGSDGSRQLAREGGPLTLSDRTTLLSQAIRELDAISHPRIEIEVPGDGTFRIINTKEALKAFRKTAEKEFPTVAAKPDRLPGSSNFRITETKIPALGKPKTTSDYVKVAGSVVSQDPTRAVINFVHSDGKNIVGTNGRVLIVVERKGTGSEKAPIHTNPKTMKVETETFKEANYPNWKQIIPDSHKFELKGVETAPLMKLIIQAKEMTTDRSNSFVLWKDDTGKLGVTSNAPDIGQFAGGEVNPQTAKAIAAFNPDFFLDGLRAARALGHDKITLQWEDDMGPSVFVAPGFKFVIMPMRIDAGHRTTSAEGYHHPLYEAPRKQPAAEIITEEKAAKSKPSKTPENATEAWKDKYARALLQLSMRTEGNTSVLSEAARVAELAGYDATKVFDDLTQAGVSPSNAEYAVKQVFKDWDIPTAESKPKVAPKQSTERTALIERIAEAVRKPTPDVVEVFETKGDDGKWYGMGGFPFGVKSTPERRSVGFAYQGKDGVRFGTRGKTREEMVQRYEEGQDKAVADMRNELRQMTDEQIASQADTWLKEKPSSQISKPTPVNAPTTEASELKRLVAKKYKTRGDELSIERLKRHVAADPSKWSVGDGVAYKVAGGGSPQTNRGFRIVAIDAEKKLAKIRQVADTGLTSSGGDMDRISDEWMHIGDLIRERKYDVAAKPNQTQTTPDEQQHSRPQSRPADAASTTRHAGEPGETGGDFAPDQQSLDRVRSFFGLHGGLDRHFSRLGITRQLASASEAPGGMAMTKEGILLWCPDQVASRLSGIPIPIRFEALQTMVLEEMAHRAHDLVEFNSELKSAVRWVALPEETKALVQAAYRSTQHPSNLGAEYVRMLVQVRNGYPLSEGFYRDTAALRDSLSKPQSPEVETLVKGVSETLFPDRLESALTSAIDALKSDPTKSYADPLFVQSIGKPVLRTALQIVRAAYRGGKALAEAIEEGLAYLRSQGKTFDEDRARAFFGADDAVKWITQAEVKSEPPAPPVVTTAEPAALPSEPSPTGIRNAIVDRQRVERGLPERMAPLRRSFGKIWDEAMAIADADATAGRRLINDITENPRPLEDWESALLAHEQVTRENAFDKAVAAVNANPGNAEAVSRLAEARTDVQAVYDAGQVVGTKSGQSLAARKLLLNEDYSLARMEATFRAEANEGRSLTGEQEKLIADLHAQIQRAKEQIAEFEEREASREAARTFAHVLSEVNREAVAARKSGSALKEFLDGQAQKARERIIARRGRLQVTIDPLNIAGLADELIIGAAHVANGISKLSDWSRQMVADFGTRIEPYLPELFRRSTEYVEEQRKSFEQKPSTRKPKVALTPAELLAGADPTTALDPTLVGQMVRAYTLQGLGKKGGVDGMTDVIHAVHADLQTVYPDVTIAEVRDAFSGYGKVAYPSRDVLDTQVREFRNLARLMSQLEDAQKRVAPKKTGLQRDAATQAVRDLTKQVKETMRRLGIATTSPEQQLKTSLDAVKTRLRNQIEDLQKQIDARTKPEGKTPIPYDAEATALRTERDRLAGIAEEIFGKPELTDEQRVNIATKALDRMIAEEDSLLRQGILKRTRAASKTPLTPELEAKRAMLDAMREYRRELAEAADPKKTPEERALARDKKMILRRIAELNRRLAAGDFAAKPKRDPVMDAEKTDLLFQEAKAKEEFNRAKFEAALKNRSIPRKAWDSVKEVLNTSRAIKTSFDLSAVGRQAGFVVFSHPIRAAKSIVPMLRAFASEKAAFAVDEEIINRPNAPLYKQSKLYLAEQNNHLLTKMEEAYMSRWAGKIPLVAGSARAYTTFLNKLRADSFDAMAATLGRSKTLTLEELKAISNFVNVATGRGAIPGAAAQAAAGLNTIFFAPRYVLSRFQIIAGQPLYQGTARTRALIATEYARYLAGVATVYALASLTNDDRDPPINLDPTSSDFLKIRFGDTRLDVMSGLLQVTTFSAREAKALQAFLTPEQERKPKYGSGGDTLWRFLRSKLSPAVGSAVNMVEGRDVTGQKVTPKTELVGLVVPISFGDIKKALQEQGIPTGVALSLLSIFGMGVQTYDDRKRK